MSDIPTGWITPDRNAGNLEGQIHHAIRERILSGQLSAGQRLPSSRALARAIGVARSTVVHAYDRLMSEGFIEALTGSATRVATIAAAPVSLRGSIAGLSIQITELSRPTPPCPLRPGIPDLASFPEAVWARCLSARARSLSGPALNPRDPLGELTLRRAILAHIATTRGVIASAEQMVILPSTRFAIDLIARLIIDPTSPQRQTAWIEDPGYNAARNILRQHGATLVPVPCDEEGMNIAAAPREHAPRLIYVTPSHQYPSGVTMSLHRRIAILNHAQSADAVIIEDDYDSEFQYNSRPIAALAGIDRAGSVAYLGTFSKTLASGIRVAYAVLPVRLARQVADQLAITGNPVSSFIQQGLADFIDAGYLRAHIRRMNIRYASRMTDMVMALQIHCSKWLDTTPGNGGLQITTRFLEHNRDDQKIAEHLNRSGFAVEALSSYCMGVKQSGLVIGIADSTPDIATKLALALKTILR